MCIKEQEVTAGFGDVPIWGQHKLDKECAARQLTDCFICPVAGLVRALQRHHHSPACLLGRGAVG